MTEQAISPLRRRMIEDMAIRKLAAKTQHDYVQRVKDFSVFLGRSPDKANKEDVRRFQLHLSESGAHTPKINATVSALRFFFDVTLDRADLGKQMTFIYEPRKVPIILSPDEVRRFLEAAPGLKYKAALSVAYGAGLRVSEVVALKICDIDSKRMIRVEQRPQRPQRDALTGLARTVARVVEGLPIAGLAIPGPRAGAADHHASAHSCLSLGGASRRDHQAREPAHVAAQLCNPSPGAKYRYPNNPGAARPFQTRHDGALHARRYQYAA
jgi:integrase